MLAFVARRLLIAIPILFLSSLLVFALAINAGDPLEQLKAKPGHSIAAEHELAHRLGLDKPLPQRYASWLGNMVHGDFGTDKQGAAVSTKLWKSLGVTIRLVLVAELLAVLLGVTVGIVSAIRQYSVFDYSSTGLSFLFYAMPVFWFAVLLKQFGAIKFNNVLQGWGFSRWIATTGVNTPNFHGSLGARMLDDFGHLVLPVIVLTMAGFAAYSRFQRASMLDTLSSDYVRTAKAKGLSTRRVIFKHAFRNALIPVTTLVALDFGALLGGAIITENVFGWSGMGTLLRNGLVQVEPNIILAATMIVAVTVVLFNIVADVLYAYLDPRIRLA